MGYLKEQENDNLIPTIPFVSKQLILNYYPIITNIDIKSFFFNKNPVEKD